LLSGASTLDSLLSILNGFANRLKGKSKSEILLQLIERIENDIDIKLFTFSLHLYLIKDLLLSEAKIKETIDTQKIANLDPLSLDYDRRSLLRPYTTRVNGALLALLFFSRLESREINLISSDAYNFMKQLSDDALELKNIGLEANHIFMLMFSESINQSIISDSGSNYEERILSVLHKIGIPANSIRKMHDPEDKSTEFDFFFTLDNRSYGIGAKRTLRERYKQFIKTSLSSHIDVSIEITLGLDLNEEKAKTIVNYGTIIFVADEIYQSRSFLQKIDSVYSVADLNIKTLKKF
jgi:hypothetical protein